MRNILHCVALIYPCIIVPVFDDDIWFFFVFVQFLVHIFLVSEALAINNKRARENYDFHCILRADDK